MTVAINGRFLIDSFGGVRRFATELTHHLAASRDDVVVLAPSSADTTDLDGVRVQTVGRLAGPAWEQFELPRWLRGHGSPLLLNFANIAPVFWRHQVTVLHDIAPAIRPQDFTLPFRVQWQLAVRFGMLRRGQHLVTVSHASQREIAERFGVDASTIEVVYEGADSLPVPPAPDRTGARTRVVAFGRHGAAKNTHAVLDAVAQLPADSDIDVEFVGKLDPELEPYAAAKGIPADRLRWTGPVSDTELAAAFARADAFVWPSLHEGFGLPPLEAQRLGAPVLASDIPINREILGDSARYFPATEPAALARLLTEISTSAELRAALSGASRANAEKFTWDATTSAWNAIIARRAR
ncbi:glycosyltransferase family 4 protein [Microbacterium testaceum]|nr:glycosyltransferase family 1 protein [Microbacterium testaceum]